MKIKLINKDKGMAPPSGAFDFRPNRTVDSNPKLDNMKGDYVSPKNRRKRKYYVGGDFSKYASPYKQLEIEDPTSKVKMPKPVKLPEAGIKVLNKEEQREPEETSYSVYWGNKDYVEEPVSTDYDSLIDLLTSEGFKFKATSGYRPSAKTAQGVPSHHSEGTAANPGAWDIVPTAGTFDEFEQRIYSNPRVLAWLDKKGWGTLREDKVVNGQRGFLRVDGTFANTGASGNHFHFGPDRRALEWKEYNRNRYARS